MDLGLTDHVFIVSGGSGGLGRAAADVLVAEGARVVLSGRDPGRLAQAQQDLGTRATTIVADSADVATPTRLVAAALDTWGRLDGALISTGGPPTGPVTEITDAQWRASFESVFLGAVRLARVVAAELDDGGSIAFVLSTSVKAPLADLAISNGLRPGLAMAAKTLADELGPRGIRVNGLLPGRVATDRVTSLDGAGGDAVRARAAAVRTIPLGRYGEPAEFGRAAAFLLSSAASFVTGVMLPVDGGLLRGL